MPLAVVVSQIADDTGSELWIEVADFGGHEQDLFARDRRTRRLVVRMDLRLLDLFLASVELLRALCSSGCFLAWDRDRSVGLGVKARYSAALRLVLLVSYFVILSHL